MNVLQYVPCVFLFFSQILMNVQWIQAHVVQELVWIWLALTGASAHLATISMRKLVKVPHTKVVSASWKMENKNFQRW